jgi:hypothetical protein
MHVFAEEKKFMQIRDDEKKMVQRVILKGKMG